MLFLAAANAFCGLCHGFYSLLFFRFLVGIFEAPIYPAFAAIAGVWFPRSERVKAIGFFDIGSYTGIGVATLVIGLIITRFAWQASFMFSGLLTALWAFVWFWYYRDEPANHPNVSLAELSVLKQGTIKQAGPKVNWLKYLGNRKVLAISLGFFCFNYLKSFYLTWLPTYVVESKHINLAQFSTAGAIPVVFAVAAEIGMAILIDRLVAKGLPPGRVKKLPVGLGMVLSTVMVFSLFTSNIVAIVALLTLSYMFLTSASVAIWSIPAELSPSASEVAVIGSIQNTFSNLAGIFAPIATGYFYGQTGSFVVPFAISIAIGIIGAVSYWVLAGKLEFIRFGQKGVARG
jgi:ACS family glucarate transporter-like MFS transporter